MKRPCRNHSAASKAKEALEAVRGELPLAEPRMATSNSPRQDGFIISYPRDFGDGWDHIVKVNKVLAPDQTNDWPMCIAGRNACPSEDVGGSYVFKEFVEIMANPKHEQYKETYR
jgi:hypothetical protein